MTNDDCGVAGCDGAALAAGDANLINRLAGGIEANGFLVQGVIADISWAYTVGLWPEYHEIVVTGMLPTQITEVLNDVVPLMRERGGEIQHSREVRGLLGGDVPVWFKPVKVNSDDYPLRFGKVWHGSYGFSAWQMIWPDPDGHWPWVATYRHGEFPQPLIAEASTPDRGVYARGSEPSS